MVSRLELVLHTLTREPALLAQIVNGLTKPVVVLDMEVYPELMFTKVLLDLRLDMSVVVGVRVKGQPDANLVSVQLGESLASVQLGESLVSVHPDANLASVQLGESLVSVHPDESLVSVLARGVQDIKNSNDAEQIVIRMIIFFINKYFKLYSIFY